MEAGDAGIPSTPRFVFLYCIGGMGLQLKSRSEQASHPCLAHPLSSSAGLCFEGRQAYFITSCSAVH